MKYRPDIDGLRALAVLSILAFHLGIQRISGGFVGVDIFYVISGFLIGGIIIRDLEEGSFSIGRFYQRRLRRILPASVAMLTVTTLIALVVLLPPELVDYSHSMVASTLWVANIYFWQTSGYFDATATSKPLLHMWSLGVEEQYYLLFPLLTLLVSRVRSKFMPAVMGLLAAASLALSVALTDLAPKANFYLLPTRAWELLFGVLIAIIPLRQLDWRPLREVVSLFGLALIIVYIQRYNMYTPFPGLHALPPCLGTAAVIAAGSRGSTAVSMILSRRPFVFLGLISYSIYLWHWPVIVLMLQGLPADHLDHTTQLVAGTLSLILAVISWHFVERPFRASTAPPEKVFRYSAAAVVSLLLMAAIMIVGRGLPARYDQRVASLAAVLNYDAPFRTHQCFLTSADSFNEFDRTTCLFESANKPNVLLIGDSHAAHLWPGLNAVFARTNVMQANASGCRPLTGEQQNAAMRCTLLMDFIYKDYLTHHRPDLIILAGLWQPDDETGLALTLDWLRQRQFAVLLVGPAPAWTLPIPKLVALAEERGDPGLVERFRVISQEALDKRLAALAAAHDIEYVSIHRVFCASDCRTIGASGLPFVFDISHLTTEGSELVATKFHDLSLRQ